MRRREQGGLSPPSPPQTPARRFAGWFEAPASLRRPPRSPGGWQLADNFAGRVCRKKKKKKKTQLGWEHGTGCLLAVQNAPLGAPVPPRHSWAQASCPAMAPRALCAPMGAVGK